MDTMRGVYGFQSAWTFVRGGRGCFISNQSNTRSMRPMFRRRCAIFSCLQPHHPVAALFIVDDGFGSISPRSFHEHNARRLRSPIRLVLRPRGSGVVSFQLCGTVHTTGTLYQTHEKWPSYIQPIQHASEQCGRCQEVYHFQLLTAATPSNITLHYCSLPKNMRYCSCTWYTTNYTIVVSLKYAVLLLYRVYTHVKHTWHQLQAPTTGIPPYETMYISREHSREHRL